MSSTWARSIGAGALGLVFAAAAVSPAAQTPDPTPVALTLRLAGDRTQFKPGELIRIELTFASSAPKRFVADSATSDGTSRLTRDEFRLSPLSLVTDPMLDYFAATGGSFESGLRGIMWLDEQPYTVAMELNDRYRFDTPGTFTLSVKTDRVTDETSGDPGRRAIVRLVSNTITFEITPRDRHWEDAEFERARRLLDGPQRMERRAGCRILRFLGTSAAVDELIRRYDDEECRPDVTAALFSAPDRAHAVQQLEAGLQAHDQAVTRTYLWTLSVLSAYLRQPELRPAQTDETKGRLGPGGELARRRGIVQAETDHYTRLFEAALPLKTGHARAVSLAEHADIVRTRPSPMPAAADAARRQVITSFADLPPSRQESLLMLQWRTVADARIIPALRQLATGSGQLADLALRRLYQLAPDEGRMRILETIRQPQSLSTLQTLGVLPEMTLPEMDEVIARNVETARDLSTSSITVALLHRYASATVAPRLLQSIPQVVGPLFACGPQAYALAYFLRTLPQQGAELLDRALSARSRTNCYQHVLLDTAQHRMSPEIEKRAIAALDDEHPRVVLSAIETLGRFGSPASAAPLRAHFDAWHRVWQNRAEELQFGRTAGSDDPGTVNRTIESAYLRALAAPVGWLTSTGDIASLRDQCVTDHCRNEADRLMELAHEATTISLSRFDPAINFEARVGHYYVDSITALARKLAAYPKGTAFTVRVTSDAGTARAISAELTAWGATRGVTIRP